MIPTRPQFELPVLSNDTIETLEHAELADVILRADMPHLAPDVSRRLPYYDRPTLVRLAYLARECSRKRLSAVE